MIYKLTLSGMTCGQCEERVRNAVATVEDARLLKINHTGNALTVEVSSDAALAAVKSACDRAGYPAVSAVVATTDSRTRSTLTFLWQLAALLGLAAVILLVSPRLHFDLSALDNTLGFGALFLVGLFTSVHCVGMCGGINMAQCMAYRQFQPDASALKPSLMYNSARLLSYTAVGAIAGALGSAFQLPPAVKAAVAMAAGAFMVILGFNMLGLMGSLRTIIPRLPSVKLPAAGGKYGPFAVGALTGFMPCGPLQAMQLYALSTGSVSRGALAMFFFALGTFPAMFSIGGLSGMLGQRATSRLLKVSGVLIVALGIIAFDRGMGFMNTPIQSIAPGQTEMPNVPAGSKIAEMEKDFQTVYVNVGPRAYEPVVVQAGVPVRMIFVVPQGNLNGCNNAIIIPALGVESRLAVGETVVEFTPTEQGQIRYACWMNMIRSTITVVADISAITR